MKLAGLQKKEEQPLIEIITKFESEIGPSILASHDAKYYTPSDPKSIEEITLSTRINEFEKTKEVLHNPTIKTPSSKNGQSYYDEMQIRILACKTIKQAGIILKIPNQTILNAQSIFHRVYFRRSLYELDFKMVALGSLYLATKCEDTHKHIRRVIQYFYFVLMVSLFLYKFLVK